MKKPLVALVLAAGEGTRFRSDTNKVLHPLLGRSMLRLVLDSLLALKPDKAYVVAGHQSEAVRNDAAAHDIGWIIQAERRGTGHAVMSAENVLRAAGAADVIILPADLPLVRPPTFQSLVARHRKRGNAVTVLSAEVSDPAGFGRIVRGERGAFRIVEDRDASPDVRSIREVNCAVYVFDAQALVKGLPKLTNANASGEYYLTDIVAVLAASGHKVDVARTDEPGDMVQVNTRYDLSRAAEVLRDRKIRALSEEGVTILNPASTWIDLDVEIGPDTVVYPSVIIEGPTILGRRCRLYPGAHIMNSRIGDRVTVFSSTVIESATIEDEVTVGPFARLRPRTILRAGSHVGNFVEMKNTDFGRGSKAGHLSYLGDSEIREGVNIGAGTITCNYDGFRKNRTVIEAGAFIGSGAELVAPVTVGRGAYVAAGSVITKDVSPDALAVARGRQFEKPGWAKRKREEQARDKK